MTRNPTGTATDRRVHSSRACIPTAIARWGDVQASRASSAAWYGSAKRVYRMVYRLRVAVGTRALIDH